MSSGDRDHPHMDICKVEDAAIVALAAVGLTPFEIASLSWDDLDARRQLVMVRGRTGGAVSVFIPRDLWPPLMHWHMNTPWRSGDIVCSFSRTVPGKRARLALDRQCRGSEHLRKLHVHYSRGALDRMVQMVTSEAIYDIWGRSRDAVGG